MCTQKDKPAKDGDKFSLAKRALFDALPNWSWEREPDEFWNRMITGSNAYHS
jgi:hypothetical protein